MFKSFRLQFTTERKLRQILGVLYPIISTEGQQEEMNTCMLCSLVLILLSLLLNSLWSLVFRLCLSPSVMDIKYFLTVMPLGQPYLDNPSLKLPFCVILDYRMLTIKTNPHSFLFYFSDLYVSFWTIIMLVYLVVFFREVFLCAVLAVLELSL